MVAYDTGYAGYDKSDITVTRNGIKEVVNIITNSCYQPRHSFMRGIPMGGVSFLRSGYEGTDEDVRSTLFTGYALNKYLYKRKKVQDGGIQYDCFIDSKLKTSFTSNIRAHGNNFILNDKHKIVVFPKDALLPDTTFEEGIVRTVYGGINVDIAMPVMTSIVKGGYIDGLSHNINVEGIYRAALSAIAVKVIDDRCAAVERAFSHHRIPMPVGVSKLKIATWSYEECADELVRICFAQSERS
jgi:hypothetical protein